MKSHCEHEETLITTIERQRDTLQARLDAFQAEKERLASVSDRAAELQAGITNCVFNGSNFQDLRAVIDQCGDFLNSQSPDQVR